MRQLEIRMNESTQYSYGKAKVYLQHVHVKCFDFLMQMLKTEKDKEEMKHEEELREVMEKHLKETQELGLLRTTVLTGAAPKTSQTCYTNYCWW